MKQLKKIGIDKWENYTGKGINVGTMEAVNVNRILDYKVINGVKEGARHGSSTALTCLETAPGITLHSIPYQPDDPRIIDYVKENKIDIIFASLVDMPYDDDIMQELKELGLMFFMGAGNKDNIVSKSMKSRHFITVASVGIDNKGKLYNIELEHDYIDFASFGVVEIPHYSDRGFTVIFRGVSYATPILAGLSARLLEAFKGHTGVKPSQDQLYRYLKENSITDGLEPCKVGHGLLMLQDPAEINYKDYVTSEEVEDLFKDLRTGRYSTKHIERLAELGILNGYSDGTFRPNQQVTREQVAVMLDKLRIYLEERR